MKHHVIFENCENVPLIHQTFDKYLVRLNKHIQRLPDEALFLHGNIERHETKQRVRATLVLNVPGRTLVAKEEGVHGEVVVRETFLELERQLKKYKKLLRAEQIWKRKARREALRRLIKTDDVPLAERAKEAAWDIISQNLDEVYNFIRRELAHYWAAGDITRQDEVSLPDLIDRVLVRAVRELSKKPSRLNMRCWLLKIALEEVEAEVQRVTRDYEWAPHHIEEDVPEVPPNEDLKTLGDWIYDFYQPDEDLRLEDLVADPQAISPDEVAESRDLQRYVNQTLAQLPKPWRDAFVLFYVEDLTISEIAHVTGQGEQEVRQSIEHAREFLRRTVEKSFAGRMSPRAEAAVSAST